MLKTETHYRIRLDRGRGWEWFLLGNGTNTPEEFGLEAAKLIVELKQAKFPYVIYEIVKATMNFEPVATGSL